MRRKFNSSMELSILNNDRQLSTTSFNTKKVTITLGKTRYNIQRIGRDSLRILKMGDSLNGCIEIIPMVSNVIRIK